MVKNSGRPTAVKSVLGEGSLSAACSGNKQGKERHMIACTILANGNGPIAEKTQRMRSRRNG